MEKILKEITYKFGALGDENEIIEYIKNKVVKNFRITDDVLGNLYVYKNKSARISVLTPVDEASFFIAGEQKGFFRFKIIGDYSAIQLVDRIVLFKDRKRGIIRNISEKDSPELSDLGVEMLDSKKPGIGEPFIIEPSFYKRKDLFLSTNLDSRAGVAFALNFLLKNKLSHSLKFIFLCQTRMREKSYYIAGREEKSEIYIILRTSPCKDGIEIGRGPVINIFSRNYVLPVDFKNKILEILKKSRLKFQLKAEEDFSYFPVYLKSSGTKKVLEISIPLKYHKNIYKKISKKDILILNSLFENFIKKL